MVALMRIEELLAASVERDASDLHLASGLPPLLRVHGDIERLELPPVQSRQIEEAVAALAQQPLPSAELDFSFEVAGLARFRANAFRTHRGAGAAFRVVPERVPSLEELGMGPVFQSIADARQGLVLITGATGSGKSTTLAAMVDYINGSRRQHILTIEEPIEFLHPGRKCLVTQRQVGRDTESFAAALRSALREDPDVILVGELRDLETIRLALTAAETGHLVFATLHTASATKTVNRIVDVFPAGEKEVIRTVLSESLQAVVAQTLVKRVGGGRVAAHEVMIATPALRHLIREHKVAQMQSVLQTSAALGMQTLDQCLQRLAASGVIPALPPS